MYKNLVIVAALVASTGSLASLATVSATTNNEVCKPLDSGKIDLSVDQYSITRHAPEGKVITGYCVKAGSTQQGNGPKYITGLKSTSVTITYPGGKAISHYSLSYGVKAAPNHQDANVTPVNNETVNPAAETPKTSAPAKTSEVPVELPKTGTTTNLFTSVAGLSILGFAFARYMQSRVS